MDAGALQMLHDARNQDVLAVANGVNFDFSTHQVLVDQYRIFNLGTGDDAHILADVRFLIGDFHALTAQYIRRTNQYRIAQTIRNLNSFFLGKYRVALCARNAGLVQDDVKLFSVLRNINTLGRGAKNFNTVIIKEFSQLNRSLTAKGNNNSNKDALSLNFLPASKLFMAKVLS